jgi:hypothetical protein
MVRFIVKGVLTEVVVDDYIPLRNNKIFFARTTGR